MIECSPQLTPKAHLFNAICHSKIGHPKAALEAVVAGLTHFPDATELLRLKGRLEVEEGRLLAAAKTFKRLTELDATDSSVAIAYSDVLLVSQKYPKCLKFSEKARKKFPDQPALLLNQIRCHLFMGELDAAANLLTTVGSLGGRRTGHQRRLRTSKGSGAGADGPAGRTQAVF